MGADERVWVHWGAGDTGGHKNKVSRDKNARTGHDLGPMAGEISPDIMFFKKSKKTCTDGSGWMYMGSHGCGGVRAYGGKQKRGETRHKWTRRTLLGMHDHGENAGNITHGNVGFKQVQTGENGCGWVWIDALGRTGHEGHKNKAIRGILGSNRSGFGTYGRGNFPRHHVLGCLAKSGVDGYRWVQIGLDGCGWTHR